MSIKGFSVSGVTDRYDYNYLDNKPEIHSIPTGGTAGQVLAKRSGADYAVEWADQTGGGGDIAVDDVLSNTSENPVQNKVVKAALDTKADQASVEATIPPIVNTWLGNNIAQETGYALDDSLTMSNAAAPAGKVGDLKSALESGQYGLNESTKQALLQIARKVAYIDDQGQIYYNALYNAFYPPADLSSITAVFSQGSAAIYDTDSLDTLRQYLVVTANYADSTTATVTDYTLSGTLAEGTSTITVSYGGKTDTFDVTVTHYVWNVRLSIADDFVEGTTFSSNYSSTYGGYYGANANRCAYAGFGFVLEPGYTYTITHDSQTSSDKFGINYWDATCLPTVEAHGNINGYAHQDSGWLSSGSKYTPSVEKVCLIQWNVKKATLQAHGATTLVFTREVAE